MKGVIEKVRAWRQAKPPLLFTVGTAALLVAGGAVAYWGLSQSRSGLPAGIRLVPQDALMTLSISTQENQWNRLRQLGTPETQQELDNLLIEWRDRLLTANGYRFRPDIKPWLGNQITVVFLPAESAADPSQSQESTQMVAILPIADAGKAQALMAEPKGSTRWVGRDYKGVQIQSVKTPTGETLETAVIGKDWLIVGNTGSGVEQIIDISSGAASVFDTAGYRQALQRISDPQAFAHLYVNLPAASQALTASPNGLPLSGSEGFAASLSLNASGLQVIGTSWLPADSDRSYAELKNAPSEMPRRLPAASLLMASGSSLQQLWQDLSEAPGPLPLLPFRPENLKAGLQNTTGLRLEEDLLPWMDGEFAFALLPPAAATDARPVDTGQLLLMVQASDREAAEATWEKLDEVMASRYRYTVETTELADQPVTQWVSPFEGIQMSHGWLEGNVTYLGVGLGLPEAILPRPQTSLAETSLFQALTAGTPKANTGRFLIDLASINQLQGALPIPQLSPGNAVLTTALQAIGVTTTVNSDRSVSYDIQVKLAKNNRSTALPEAPSEEAEEDAEAE
ncbi:MAG: DUF3352 domain-containing protein [Leptolyngbya sp. SIO4C1]|nr:DUF3352 domain-containing protein [Leptolyngbya sp. SIO4C1]